MDEREEVVSRLADAGVLAAIAWAWDTARARTLEDFSEEQGHDETWFGVTCHTLFKDRLHRVFSTGKYLYPADDGSVDGSLALQGLLPAERDSMPRIDPGLVSYGLLNGSPAWLFDGHTYLLASAPVGHVKDLPWARKSPTKRAVAARRAPNLEPSLFTGSDLEDPADALTPWFGDLAEDALVLAHSLSSTTGESELILGRPRYNEGGGYAWYWHHDILAAEPSPVPRRAHGPVVAADDPEPDAPVRLRRDIGTASPERRA